MNLIKTKLFAVMILFIVTSCASQSVPQKLDDFVNTYSGACSVSGRC